jgi:hypothetical protein|tara:strand:+ start:549 stop:866 length:318 start_codon:yes stop_codon:yes gene_type:complete
MKKEAKELRDEITELIKKKVYDYEIDHLRDKKLVVIIEIFENWFNLDGSIKKKDIQNREKFLIDSVFKALDLDDKNIFDCRFIKRQALIEKSIVQIREYISELST